MADTPEDELVRLTLELHRLHERRVMLERRRDELAAYLNSVHQFPAPDIRPAAPEQRQPNPHDPLDTATWLQRQQGERTTALRPEKYRSGSLSQLSYEVVCPLDCKRDYEHQHYADGQIIGFEGR